MQYKPVTAVWEITFACNMRCKHCGSSCTTKKPNELTEEEALNVCDQIGEMGLKHITISGGEPLMSDYWYKIAKRLKENNITPNMITNGWLLTKEQIELAKESGISNIAISLDGTKDTHDFMRREGSFDRISKAFDLLKECGMPASSITTVNNRNLKELPAIYEFLKEKNVMNWQIQSAMPMGNFIENKDMVLEPKHIDDIIDIAHKFTQERIIRIDLSDCIGYYSPKEIEVRTINHNLEEYVWQGCSAGKQIFGIRYNGDVVGCASLRDGQFVEGNVRDKTIKEIWEGENSFAWNRKLKKSDLSGFCAKCQYGAYCLAGCAVLKFTTGNKLRENNYCSYKVAVDHDAECINEINDLDELMKKGAIAIEEEDFQVADMFLSKALSQNSNDLELIGQLGYVNFRLENMETSLDYNKKALAIDSNNVYAYKGQGLCYAYTGEIEKGISSLKRAIELTDENFMDPYYDLAIIYHKEGKYNEAEQILLDGNKKSKDFANSSADLLHLIRERLN